MSETLEPFDWHLAHRLLEHIRFKDGSPPYSVEFHEDWMLVKFLDGCNRIAYTKDEAAEEFRMARPTSLKIILRDDFQTNGAFVVPEIWRGEAANRRDRSEVVDIPILPRKL